MDLQTSTPYVKIIEQPAPDRSRFRYESERVSILMGVSSTAKNKTYPTIQIFGHTGKAVAIMSCVTEDEPYRPHPFNIDGRQGCKKGVCSIKTSENTTKVEFRNVGIKCVKKKGVPDSLKERQQIQVDPFKTGFDMDPSSYDFGSVRLCFQVFTKGEDGKYTVPIAPVVSDPVYDRKNIPDVVINKISICVCRVDEEPEIIILCGKISGDNIQVRFYEEHNGELVWEAFGAFNPSQVHRQVAISFKAPKYYNLEIENPVRVLVQLRRPSDKAFSEPIPFEYLPSEEIGRKRKAPRIDGLLDLARCIENCGFNPLMNFRKEKVATRRIQSMTPPTGLPANIEPIACHPNMPTSSAPYAVLLPQTIQPEPNAKTSQCFMPDDYHLNVPNQGYQNPERSYAQANTFDIGQFASQYESVHYNNVPQEANPIFTDSFTKLAWDPFDSLYQQQGNFT